jgi:hypothetical protein
VQWTETDFIQHEATSPCNQVGIHPIHECGLASLEDGELRLVIREFPRTGSVLFAVTPSLFESSDLVVR